MTNFQIFAQQLIRYSSRCIFFTDVEGRLTMVSDAAKKHFAEKSDTLIGQMTWEVVSDSRLKLAVDSARDAFQSGEKVYSQTVLWDGHGVPSTLHFQGNQVVGEEGEKLGYTYVFTFEEVSQELRYDKTILNNLMRNSQDMIYFKDAESRFTHVSDSMIERLGASSVDELIGKSDFDYWDEVCAKSFYEDEQEIIRTREPLIGKAEKEIRADGKTTWVLSTKMPLIDENDQVIGTFGISKDITAHKEVEAELEQTNKKLLDASRHAGMAEVATNVIHNVGNVLNSINVSVSQASDISRRLKIENLSKVASLINEHARDEGFFTVDEKGKRIPEYLRLIATELQNDRDEIKKELEATKKHLEHIKMIVAMQQEYATANCVVERVDMAEVLEDAIRMSSGALERHRIDLVKNYCSGFMVSIDKHRVLQILVNLIRNAKHAMQDVDAERRQLTISASLENSGHISVQVTDTGMGISQENLVKLFTHGFTTKHNGHGFGLHSGANTAKELGGSLTAHSDGLGHGATFTLTLPVAISKDKVAAAPILHGDVAPPTSLATSSLN